MTAADRGLERRLAQAQRDGRLPSIAASVSRRGEVVWAGGAGVVSQGVSGRPGDGASPTPDTQYRIGSITKSMVAVAVLRLVDAGVVALDDPVAEHLPGAEALGRVRVEQLLTHSGGLPSETSGPWWERVVGAEWASLLTDLGQRPSVLRSGQQFHYSNPGFAVLGALLDHARGTDWYTVVRTEVLTPLGMARTSYHPSAPHAVGRAVHPHADLVLPEPAHDGGAMAPAGQLWSTTDDLVRWAAFLAGDGTAPDGQSLLRRSTMAMLRTPLAVDDRPGQPWTTAWGLGVSVHNIDGRRLVGHGGSMPGFLATVLADPDDGIAVTVLANATHGLPPALATDLLRAGDEQYPATTPPWTPADQRDVLELVGVWYWGSRAQLVTADRQPDGRTGLHLAPLDGPGRASRFVRDGGGAEDAGTQGDGWLGRDAYYAGERLTVVRRQDGSIDHLDLGSFVLTRLPYDSASAIPGGVDPGGWRH